MEEDQIVLTEAQVRAIIQDELSRLNLRNQADRTIVQKKLQIMDAKNIQLGKTNGTKIGTEATQKIGFFGVTPVAQQSAIAAPSGSGTAGVDSSARTQIVDIINKLKALGLTA